MSETQGRIALVTGASRGIGKAIAAMLAGQGFIVVGTATTEAGAAGITEALAAQGHAGGGVVMDVSDSESVTRANRLADDGIGHQTRAADTRVPGNRDPSQRRPALFDPPV